MVFSFSGVITHGHREPTRELALMKVFCRVSNCMFLCVRLRCFYQTEWDKVHQKYQEEADKCRMLMEQQVRMHTRTHSVIPVMCMQ